MSIQMIGFLSGCAGFWLIVTMEIFIWNRFWSSKNILIRCEYFVEVLKCVFKAFKNKYVQIFRY